ncbi:DUF58 domain-containing protein [Roseimaritima ulvae]|uniref:VWA domain containing CoxE-like protein n=1 Tax=Roseimaritima ulvae TaxID=980254 RepID=A0A5B9QQV9_9BACT|nr:DUF58 domain-containing protein [Roseimaritima ulvae]QEG41384.1 VWA domain containing CoxE-like protein [Roseimaritima ulvae]
MFDSEFLKRLEYLSLLSKRVFKGQLLAQRRSKQLGGGVEFADHRDYLHGDDLRYLDWNVYARHGDLLLKRFQEEQDLHVYLLLDASESMNTGEPNKFLFARQIAAALAYIALADLDRVSIVAYDDKIVDTLPLMRGKDNVLALLRFLDQLKTGGKKTDLAAVASEFGRRAPRTGMVLIISDLFDQAGFRDGIDRLRHQRFDPHVIQIHTQQEAQPTLLGDVEFEDVESHQRRKVTVTERKLEEYKTLFANFNEDIQRYCRTYGLSHTRATTDVPFDAVLLKMMRATA